MGKCVASAGKVTGSLPPGSALPSSTSAVAGPPSWPGYHISRIDLTDDAQGMSTGSPVLSTTTVFGLAAATAAIRLVLVAGQLQAGAWSEPPRSLPSVPSS